MSVQSMTDGTQTTDLVPLFEQARRTGKWFFHGEPTGPPWFSPDHLAELQARGSYCWLAEHWVLRHLCEWLADLESRVRRAQEEAQRVKAELRRARVDI
jgi:hypothetical protein